MNFYATEIEDQGAYCFCPVCHSVRLSETLTLLITLKQWVLEFCYFIWVFLVIRHFHGYHYFLTCDLDLGVWPSLFFYNFNLAYNFSTVSARALIVHMNIPCDNTFPWISLFFPLWPWPWSLTHFWKILELSYEHFLWQDFPTGIKIFVLVTLTIFGIGHYRGHLCFTNTSCFYLIFFLFFNKGR